MDSKGVEKPNQQYIDTNDLVRLVRDSVAGEAVVKREDRIKDYLPYTCEDIKDAEERSARFKRYAAGAEFDDIPGQTLESIKGAIFRNETDMSQIPAGMAYMLENADGDGMSLEELIKICASELLMMKYFGALAEYSDLANVDIEELTVQRTRDMGAQASIKVYPRESIINWNFKRINGVLQLCFLVLKEVEEVRQPGRYDTEKVNSYLVLGLDDDGEYYQQKYVDINDGEWSEIVYPMANGANLDYIPFEFCTASDYPKGKIPSELGYIAPICSKTIHRFRTSAEMKEALWMNAAPMTYSTNWDEQSLELYKAMTGRDYISNAPGSHLPMPMDSTVGILSWDMSVSAYADYMDRNEREIRALGGKFDTTENQANETATAAIIRAAEKNGNLSSMVTNLEQSISRVIGYCAKFMGVDASVELKINREFYVNKLSPQERTSILAEWQTGLISQEEALNQLKRGGALTVDVEVLIQRMSDTGE